MLFKSVNTIHASVHSASASFVERESSITVMAATHLKKAVIEKGKAVGVTACGPVGQDYAFLVKYEIILACGVFEVPSS